MRNLLLDFDLPHSKRNRVWMTIKNVRSRIEKPKAICEKRDAFRNVCRPLNGSIDFVFDF